MRDLAGVLSVESAVPDAKAVAMIDGVVTLFVIVVTYILAKGYTAWAALRKK